MTSRIIEQQQAISAVLAEDHKNWNKLLTDKEFWVIKASSIVFEPFTYLTNAHYAEKIVTVSTIHPVMKHKTEVLTMVKETDSRLTKQKIRNDNSKCSDDERIQQLLLFLIQGSRNVCLTMMIQLK